MSDYLELLPAVDMADGQAVQLVQGVAGSEKHFGDPVEAALRWQNAGAEWIHLVDLDAAFGRGHNRELQAQIVGRLDINVEMSGGIRDQESLEAAMATGCRRVNIGTAALEQPSPRGSGASSAPAAAKKHSPSPRSTQSPSRRATPPCATIRRMIVGILSVATDISQRLHAEESLRLERDFARQILSTMGQGLTVVGADGRFSYVNPAFARMSGIPQTNSSVIPARIHRPRGPSHLGRSPRAPPPGRGQHLRDPPAPSRWQYRR